MSKIEPTLRTMVGCVSSQWYWCEVPLDHVGADPPPTVPVYGPFETEESCREHMALLTRCDELEQIAEWPASDPSKLS